MTLTSDLILMILDIVVIAVFIKQFLIRKVAGGFYKKVFISICLVSFADSVNTFFIALYLKCSTGIGSVMIIIAEHMIIWAAVISIILIDRRFADIKPEKNIMLTILIYFPVMGIIWNIGYSYYVGPSLAYDDYERLNSHIAIITWILLIVMDYLLCIAYYMITKYQNDRTKSELLSQQYEAEKRHYKDIEQMQKSVRGIRHDLVNMLQTAQHLIAEGDYTGVSKLIDGIGVRLKQDSNMIITGNPALDSIIGIKLSKAAECCIAVEKDIDVPPGLDLNYESMATIFGNLLDNAIEAQMDIPETDRILRLFIKYMDGMMVISIGNSCRADRYNENGYGTTKDDIENHGFGIQNAMSSVERLGGTMQLKRSMEWFDASIILYDITSDERQ